MDRELYIDGEWRPAQDGWRIAVTEPATGAEIGTTAVASPADLDVAVAAARASAWPALSAEERGAVLRRAADLIDRDIDEIALLLTREQGKTISDSRKEIAFAAEVFRYYADEGLRIGGSLRHSVRADVKSIVSYEPIGVVAAIVPWNYPVDLYAWKVAPALAAGCPVIAKPPHDAPLAIARVVAALAEAGAPAGALADLPGKGELGAAMVSHPGIDAITATVSTATGRQIAAAAAPTLKRVNLELGGQSPLVVLDDADIAEAAAAAVRRSFSNMGQICIAVNRVLVADARREEFRDAASELTRALKIGDPTRDGIDYGPVFDDAVMTKTRGHIDQAIEAGARLVTGGQALDDGPLFIAPALLDEVPVTAQIMNEETFGPALAIAGARSDAELLTLANALPYGLAAYVYSADLERAWAFADRVQAGGVGINVNDVSELQAPFGGWKLSGGGRDLGPEGLHAFLQTRHIRARVRPIPRK
jgi:succinate-semialdehyde dehydrogenase/glutarate-semialdehyde dehydrogenase